MGKYAIFIILALTISLFTYGQGIQSSWMRAEVETVDSYERSQARNIARSAASAALQAFFQNEDFAPEKNSTVSYPAIADSFLTWPDLSGSYRLDLADRNDSLIISATGKYSDKTYHMDVILTKTGGDWNPELPNAVFAENNIRMTGSARIYGNAGTNTTDPEGVNLDWSTKIDSTLSIGPGANPAVVVRQPSGTSIGEGIEVMSQPKKYELPEFPAFPAKANPVASVHIKTWPPAPSWTPADFEGKFIPEFRVSENVTHIINVGDVDRVMHVGHLNIEQGHVMIVGTGKVTLYVEDRITLGGSSTFNSNRTPQELLTFYAGAPEINFAGSTIFRGDMYAEKANVVIGGSGGVTGHLLTGGTSVIVSGDASAHTRVLFAPNAHVSLEGSGKVVGPIVAKTFMASGGTWVRYTKLDPDALPEFKGGDPTWVVSRWR